MNMDDVKVLHVFVQPVRKFRRVAEPLAESHRKEDCLRSMMPDRSAFLNAQPVWSIGIRGGHEHLDSARLKSAGHLKNDAAWSSVARRDRRDDM